jgi:probable F420-dependent oxidoreductase
VRLNVAFPNVGLRVSQPTLPDVVALRDQAQALEALGVDGLQVVDHVTYAWPNADGSSRSEDYGPELWHLEPLITLGYIAAVTERIGLETAILILPQRPPALVAKQAATLDVLSKGRLRLGVGIGWQENEYEAMGVPFADRAGRIEESISVLKKAWTETHINHDGRYFRLDNMAMEPKPVQKPHPPILMGGESPRVMERIGRLANGWVAGPQVTPEAFAKSRGAILASARAAGREDETTIFEASFRPVSTDPADRVELMRRNRAAGATEFCFWMGREGNPGLKTYDQHLRYIERLIDEVWPEFDD